MNHRSDLQRIARNAMLARGLLPDFDPAALLLERRIGERFDGIVTGAADKGTWVRVFAPPVEGRGERGAEGLRVGDKVRVRLLSTDFERGFLDFARERREAAGAA